MGAMCALVAERMQRAVHRVLGHDLIRVAADTERREEVAAPSGNLAQLAQEIDRLSRRRHDEVFDRLASLAAQPLHLQLFERDHPSRLAQIEIFPFRLGHGVRQHEGQRE